MSPLFVVVAQALTTLAAFAVFFYLAKRFFWPNIIGALDERRDKIRAEFARADELQAQADRLKGDYTSRIAEIEAEARNRIQEALAQAKTAADQIIANARAEADSATERSRQAMNIEVDKARAELREEVVRLTLGATERLVRQNLNTDEHKRLVGGFVEELARR